jgi:methylmalonyl-CoA mutase C-terminal domain/subunit
MARNRIVVGAVGDDDRLREAARGLRDAGHEVVLVGGRQTPAQLARTAVAEDASHLVVEGDADQLAALARECAALGASDIVVGPWCDAIDAATPRLSG